MPPPLIPPMLAATHHAHPPKSGRGWMIIAILAIMLLLGIGLVEVLEIPIGSGFPMGASYGDMMEETTVEQSESLNKIVVVNVSGVITAQGNGDGMSIVSLVKRMLKRAAQDDNVKAVILRVNSPGGEVLASDDIAEEIKRFQLESNKPVIASMGTLAASGGYYVSAPCRWIVAHPLTITGSIGVIMQGFNYRDLMDKVGVRPDTFKSGKHKDMLSGMRAPDEIPEDERALIQDLIDEIYGRFKTVVKEGREWAHGMNKMHGFKEESRELAEGWEKIADGRVFSGTTAYNHGFVDELGGMDIAIKRAKKLVGISEAKVVSYQMPFDFANILRLFGKSSINHSIKVDLGLNMLPIKTGYLYFLSPTFLL